MTKEYLLAKIQQAKDEKWTELVDMIQFMGFPNGTDNAKSLRAADGSKTTCDFEFDFHGTH